MTSDDAANERARAEDALMTRLEGWVATWVRVASGEATGRGTSRADR
jgi:hypothetical protein